MGLNDPVCENLLDRLYGEYMTWHRLNQDFWKIELPPHDWNMSFSFQLQSRWINEDWGARRRQMLGNLKISDLTVKKILGLEQAKDCLNDPVCEIFSKNHEYGRGLFLQHHPIKSFIIWNEAGWHDEDEKRKEKIRALSI